MDGSEGHSLVEWRGRAYMYGGKRRQTDTYSSELWEIDVDPSGALCQAKGVQCHGAVPPPRAYHAACLARGSHMLVVGGVAAAQADRREDVVWLLDLEERTWQQFVTSGEVPHSRCHHTLSMMPSHDRAVLYGGYPLGDEAERVFGGDSQPAQREFYDVYELSLGDMAWTRRRCTSAMPPLLWGHSALLYHQNLIVFGGVDVVDCAESGTVCVWHCERQQWRWVEFNRAPRPRAIHAAAAVDGRMLVFGGFGNVNSTKFNDTWEFSLETGQWTELAAGGAVPAPRSGHAAAALPGGRVVVVGGVDADHQRLSDVHTLNVPSGMWAAAAVDAQAAAGGFFPGGAAAAAPPPAVQQQQYTQQYPPARDPSPQPAGSPRRQHLSPPRPGRNSGDHPPPAAYAAAPLAPFAVPTLPDRELDHITPWTDPPETPVDFRSTPVSVVVAAAPEPPPAAAMYSQQVQTEPLPAAHPSPRQRVSPPPPVPATVAVPVAVESQEATWLHAEAADIIQKQRVELEALRSQLEARQRRPSPPRLPRHEQDIPQGMPNLHPGLTFTKETVSDMMPRLAINIADTPLLSPPRHRAGQQGAMGLMSREATAAVIERRLGGGPLGQAWGGASPLLNPSLLPTAPIDCARHTTQRRDLGLAAPQPQAAGQAHPAAPREPAPQPIPAELSRYDPLSSVGGAGGGPAGPLPSYHPQRYTPPSTFAEMMQRAAPPAPAPAVEPPYAAQWPGGAGPAAPPPAAPAMHGGGMPGDAGGMPPPSNKSPSLRKILSGQASMLSITHVDPRHA